MVRECRRLSEEDHLFKRRVRMSRSRVLSSVSAVIAFAGCAFCLSSATATDSGPGSLTGCWIMSLAGVCGSGLTAPANLISCNGQTYPEYRWNKPDVNACVNVVNGYRDCWTVSVWPTRFRAYCDPNNPSQMLEDEDLSGAPCDSAARSRFVCGMLQGPPIPISGD